MLPARAPHPFQGGLSDPHGNPSDLRKHFSVILAYLEDSEEGWSKKTTLTASLTQISESAAQLSFPKALSLADSCKDGVMGFEERTESKKWSK